ncbi:MAG: LamB/YcsF family protein [Clostridia bacterium]|nr:LamB/YcsF family protein [Clostridia bacterium]
MKNIDINADMGEGYGIYKVGDDAALMPYITSANIACGFHAGDYNTMHKTVGLAQENKLKIGAHPGYPDRMEFGRKAMHYDLEVLRAQLLYQLGALDAMIRYRGGQLHHVKPHGAFYHLATSDKAVAEMIAETVAAMGQDIALVGMYEAEMRLAASKYGLPYKSEIFADRRYQKNGLLVPRDQADAVITDVDEGIAQIKALLTGGYPVDTICVHGDNRESLIFAKAIYDMVYGNDPA